MREQSGYMGAEIFLHFAQPQKNFKHMKALLLNYSLFGLILCLLVLSSSCEEGAAPQDGEELAMLYCTTCHSYPEPESLDHSTWKEHVLPRMGQFMGIYENPNQRQALIEKGPAATFISRANIYPEQAMLSEEQWSAIQDFYLEKAPPILRIDSIAWETTDLFKIKYPDLYLSPPSTTFVSMEQGNLFFADANKKQLFQLKEDLSMDKQAKIGEGIVSLHSMKEQLWVTTMGSFSPTDNPSGFLFKLSSDPEVPSAIEIPKLQRPIHSTFQDFNNDGTMEVLICEFGKWTGALSLWIQSVEGQFNRTNLVERPGAISTHPIEINGDEFMDFIVLFGQGAESIQLFQNRGDLTFSASELVSLPPSMGSSSLSLFDYNGDGLQDLLYTAGDNADYPPVVKPYHGIYVFTQGEDQSFEQALFLPLPGAYKAIPSDFDLDGDLDIAAISFFPDYNRQGIGFVLYENTGAEFKARRLPLRQSGRWIVMDIGDIDADGDEDLVLGSLTFEAPQNPTLVQNWVKNGLPFAVLENQSR